MGTCYHNELDSQMRANMQEEIHLALKELPDNIIEDITRYAEEHQLSLLEAMEELLSIGEAELGL